MARRRIWCTEAGDCTGIGAGIGTGGGGESNCRGEGCAGWKLFELTGRIANGLLVVVPSGFNDSGTFSAGELPIVACSASEAPGAGWHS